MPGHETDDRPPALTGDLWDSMPDEPPSPADVARAAAEEYCTGDAECLCHECQYLGDDEPDD